MLTVIVAEEEKQQWRHMAAAAALVKVNFFQKGRFYIEGFHFYKVNVHFFNIFLKIYLEIPLKIGIKVGIHFYENILSEINLPLCVQT